MKNAAAFSKKYREEIFLCLAVLLCYASVWQNGFVFEDRYLIVLNAFLKHWSSLPHLLMSQDLAGSGNAHGVYRPVPMLVYFFMYQAFGLSAVAFHALNIALHAFNACLLYTFGIRAGFKKGAAFAAALLWAVHPLYTIDVAYISSTAELLRVSFCLLGLVALLPDFTTRKIWTAMTFFILALGCKESSVVFPVLATITFFYVSEDRTRVAAYFKTWPLWLLAVGFTTVWMVFIHKTSYSMDGSGDPVFLQYYAGSLKNRILTSLATLPVYAGLIIWPAGLHIERLLPIFPTLLEWKPAAGLLMAGLALLQIFRGQKLTLSFGLLWFAVALAPVTGIVVPVDAIICDGWMYMPAMGLFLGAAQTAADFLKKDQHTMARFVIAGLALVLGIVTFTQNEVWHDNETLYQNIAQNGGRVDRISSYLSLSYLQQHEFDKAAGQLQVEIDHPNWHPAGTWGYTHFLLAMAWLHVPVNEGGGFIMNDVARALTSSPHIPEAVGELGQALQDNPDYYPAHQVLAVIYRYQGNNQMADFHLRKAEGILQKQGNSSR